MRSSVALFVLGIPLAAAAQVPDVALRIDLNLNYQSTSGSKNRIRWYDPLGRHSVVGVGMTLEPGYYVLITERMQRIPGDIDTEQIDEAYIEDPGRWRIGRQYLPFGSRGIIREAALGARAETPLLNGKLNVRAQIFDNGRDKLRGGMVRLGDRFGVSAAIGSHIGAAATSLGTVRDPQDSPGPGRGYQAALGADGTITRGRIAFTGEFVALRKSNSPLDGALDISDLKASITGPGEEATLTVGWSREWIHRDDNYRVESLLKLAKNLSLKSFVRFERGTWKDLSIGLRIRL